MIGEIMDGNNQSKRIKLASMTSFGNTRGDWHQWRRRKADGSNISVAISNGKRNNGKEMGQQRNQRRAMASAK